MNTPLPTEWLGPIGAIGAMALLFGLTGFGIWQAFGPPSRGLIDSFDEHDD